MAEIILWTATNCVKCPKAKEIFKEVVKELNLKEGIDYEIKNVDENDNMIEALMHQIASTPSITIGNEIIYNGEIPNKGHLMEIIKNMKQKN